MKSIFYFSMLLGLGCQSAAQTDNIQLVNEAAAKLQNSSATVSEILTDKKYLSIHALSAFRDVIKAGSNTQILVIATSEEPGKKIRVLGTVTDSENKPVENALVYLYQTDTRGWYSADAPHVGGNEGDMLHAKLFGYVKTNNEGKFELQTIKPSGYPQSDLPAHIHVHIWADSYRDFVNEFLFDDDERLKGTIREQSIRNHFLIQKPEKAAEPFDQQFSYQIQLSR